MTKPMDKTAEAELLDAVRSVSQLVEDGADPTQAITKVAGDTGLGAGMIPLLVQAYNVGRTTFQQEHGGSGILDKQASFPIARLEEVMGELYPSQPLTPAQAKSASVISSDYFQAPTMITPDEQAMMTKVAERDIRMPEADRPGDLPVNMEALATKSLGSIQREKRALDDSGMRYRMAREGYLNSMGALRAYFKEAEYFRLPFHEVEYNAVLLYGVPAKHALDYAYIQNGMREKRANGPPRYLCRVDRDKAPYSLIAAAIKSGADLIKAKRDFTAAEKRAARNIKEARLPFEPALGNDLTFNVSGAFLGQSSSSREKGAGFLGNLASMSLGASMRGGPAKSPDQLVDAAEMDLSDPAHLQELQEIKTRAMLSDMMNNDEVISGYEPDEVLDAYNEIAQLSPRASQQPAVIRPLLRKHLTQGAVEPFEAQQIADIEKTVAQTGAFTDESIPAGPASPGGVPGQGKSEVLSGSPLLQ